MSKLQQFDIKFTPPLLANLCTFCLTFFFFLPLSAQPFPFINEAQQRGVDFPLISSSPGSGAGIAAIDLDMDGDADLVITGAGDYVEFLENDGTGNFTSRTNELNLPKMELVRGVAAGDPDADGDLDLLLLNYFSADYFLRNNGDFQFTVATEEVGLTSPGNSTGAAFGDLNGDGWLDLLVVCGVASEPNLARNKLYYNDGDGTFSAPMQIDPIIYLSEPTFQGMLQDFDLDGDLDIYISNDRGNVLGFQNWMLENEIRTFTNRSDLGSGVSIDSMGICAGDINLDGLMDLYCTNMQLPHPLLQNQGDFVFTDVTSEYGVGGGAVSWGTFFLDYELDGDLDLFVLDSNAPDRLFRQQGPGQWVDIADMIGLDNAGWSYCAVPADLDLDGDIDLVTQQHFGSINLLMHPDQGNGNFFRLDPVAPHPNHFAVGTRIECRNESGELFYAGQRGAGQYFKSEGEWIFQHGLGTAENISEIRVFFPGGVTRILHDLPANETWKLYHPDLLGDFNRDGLVNLADGSQFLIAVTDDFSPGHEIFDIDGNSQLDVLDLEFLLSSYDGIPGDCDGDGVVDLMELFLGTMTDSDGDAIPDECDRSFIRGDVNIDLTVDISDPIQLLQYLFLGDDCPCIAAIDINYDGQVNIADPVSLLGYLFSSAAAPGFPFPECGNVADSNYCLSSGCP